MFPYKNACFVSLESGRPGVDSVREKLVLGFISRSCHTGLCDGAAQLFPLWDPWMLWPDLHSESFAGTAWDVTFQSSCKITVTRMGSSAVPQKQPALLKLDIAKPGSAGSGGEPIRIPPVCTCLGQAVPVGPR